MTDTTDTPLRHTDFQPLVGETFHIHYGEGEQLPVTLSGVVTWGPGYQRDGQHYQPFTLTFQSSIRQYLPQGMFTVSHGALGDRELFIVPHAPNAVGVEYEIIFS